MKKIVKITSENPFLASNTYTTNMVFLLEKTYGDKVFSDISEKSLYVVKIGTLEQTMYSATWKKVADVVRNWERLEKLEWI
jgi:hypothetical protein